MVCLASEQVNGVIIVPSFLYMSDNDENSGPCETCLHHCQKIIKMPRMHEDCNTVQKSCIEKTSMKSLIVMNHMPLAILLSLDLLVAIGQNNHGRQHCYIQNTN